VTRKTTRRPVSIGNGLYGMVRAEDFYTLDSLRTTMLPSRDCGHDNHDSQKKPKNIGPVLLDTPLQAED
jgi:hypothetical protein